MIAITFLLILVSCTFSISKAGMAPELIVPALKIHDSADNTLISDPYTDPVLAKDPTVENPENIQFSKKQDDANHGLRKMLKEMFDLLRSPNKDEKVIIHEFKLLYQPQFRDQVCKFLKMMGRHSKIHITQPILQRQRLLIPILLKLVSSP